ncbi:MAG: FUSC family protein [Motilibacteraceae bacterium]
MRVEDRVEQPPADRRRGEPPTSWLRRALLASDPGLLRLRLGVRALLAVAVAIGVESRVAPAVGVPTLVGVLLGGMVAMNGSFAASGRPPREAYGTLAWFPAVASLGVVAAGLLAPARVASLAGFVVAMVVAVYVRRFGTRGFAWGILGWLGYFFATFTRLRLSQFPAVLAVLLAATACVVLAEAVVPDRPERALARARTAFELRVGALVRTCRAALAGGRRPEKLAGQLHARRFRLIEAALLVDGYLALAAQSAQAGATASAARHRLLDIELAADSLAGHVEALVDDPAADVDLRADPCRRRLLDALDALAAGDLARARALAGESVEAACGADSPTAGEQRGAAAAVAGLADALAAGDPQVPGHLPAYEPAVGLFLGQLPGTMPSASAAVALSRGPAARASVNLRQCVQAAVAGSLTLVVGVALSPQRYYWALLACFFALTGTPTSGETATKAVNRVLGTLVGIVAAVLAVHLVGRHTVPVVVLMLACVFLGLYFFRVSYAIMAFAVTTLMGLLYDVLGEFTDRLLVLRLAETALGAAIGIAAALLVLPVRTGRAVVVAREEFVARLRELLDAVARRLGSEHPAGDLFLAARRLDAQLHQLALVSRPAAGLTLLGLDSRRALREIAPYTAAAEAGRALAGAVADLRTLPQPAAAAHARALLSPDGDVPIPAGDVADRRLAALLDDAVGALQRVSG